VRLRIAVALAALAAIVIAFVLGVGSITRSGLSVHEEPSAMEAMMARRMRALAVPADLENEKNPVPLTPEVLAEARSHFADHCATCHGNDGKGATAIGQKLYPRAPDMTLPETRELSDGALFAIIENGVRLTGMPGWGTGTAQSAYGSWTLVHFIRHLPKLTPAELREMERLNPMSRAAIERIEQGAAGAEDAAASGAAGHAATPHEH
jgi:mono/diheme cytochrome c family protein